MHPDERVARLASGQHGLVTYRQLTHIGLSRGSIRRRRESHRLQPVYTGVFAVGHGPLTDEARLLAAVMACGPQAVLSHEHAAQLWGLMPHWEPVDLSRIHVTVPSGSGRGRRQGIVRHRAVIAEGHRRSHRRIPVTSPARTLLDLGRSRDPRRVERAIDQALTDRRTTPSELRAVLTDSAGSRGAATLRTVLDASERFDTLTRSELEEEFLRLVRGARLPAPTLNARTAGIKVDATWRAERLVVELDGYRWHRTRSRAESDRDREARLRRAGWAVVRYSARQVFGEPLLVVADLVSMLAQRQA